MRITQPDLILMDIKMATDQDGLDAARTILSEGPACVIMVSAYEEYKEESEQLGASGYVVKPIDSTTLAPQLAQAYRRFRQKHPDIVQ